MPLTRAGSHIRRAIAISAAAAIAALASSAAPASAAVTCSLNTGTGEVTVTVTNGTPNVYLSHAFGGSGILIDDNGNLGDGDLSCTNGPVTDANAKSIAVNEAGSNQGTVLEIDFVRGRLAPGIGDTETGGTPEIEVAFNTDTTGTDEFNLRGGTETDDQSFQFGALSATEIGVDLNGDNDGDDLRLTDPELIYVWPGTGDDTVTADGSGDLSFTGPDPTPLTVIASQGNETLAAGSAPSGNSFDGGPGNDTITGGAGAETVQMTVGDDTFDGGGGSDVASYELFATTAGVTLDLGITAPQDTGPDTGTDQVTNVENIFGSNGPDRLTGDGDGNALSGGHSATDTGDDVLVGLGGTDALQGRAGNDLLIGGQGNDILFAGPGSDTASFASGSTGPVTFSLNPALTGTFQSTGGAGMDALFDSDGDTQHEVENLIGTPFGGDMLTGNALANRIDLYDGLMDTADCVGPPNGNLAIADELMVDVLSNCETTDNAPQTSVAGPADGAIAAPPPTYSLTADEPASFQLRVDGGAFQPCGASCAPPLADGTHALAFRAVDADENGNIDLTPVTRTVTIVTPPPVTPAPATPITATPPPAKKCKKGQKLKKGKCVRKKKRG